MMIVLTAHGIAAFLLGSSFKVHIIFPLVAFVVLEAIFIAVTGGDNVLAFLLATLCITQVCYALGIAARALIERWAARRRDGVTGKFTASNNHD